jgi:hypothetical protein
LNPRQPAQLTVSGQALRWTRVDNVNTYVLMRLVPGQIEQDSVVSGTSIMPPPVPGVTVGYSIRTTAKGSAWSTEQSITYASASKTTDPQAAPALTVSGQTLTWNAPAKVDTYILMTEVPGKATQYSEVSGTSTMRPPVPGATVRYSVRTAVEGSAWAPEVAISYPAPSPVATQPTGPPASSNSFGPWLGLNGNSGYSFLGGIADFTKDRIVYDRSGGLEFSAGETGTAQVAASINAGMIPVVTIDYAGYKGNWGTPDPNFPHTATQINSYVSGFITTAKAILTKYPGKTFLFEPMNEPEGYTEPLFNAAEYANVIAALLPEAQKAGIPLSHIYVFAIGENCPPGKACEKNRWVRAMYEAQPALTTEIQGWYFHPYGAYENEWDNWGIQNMPAVRSTMTAGQNNIIISEVGYEGNSTAAAQELTKMLNTALSYHEEGWLKALIVYSRGAAGWAMQKPGGSLTGMGEALVAFAEAHG